MSFVGVGGFRGVVREWLRENLPPTRVVVSEQDQAARGRQLQRRLFDAGLAGLSVPVEYGGQGLPDDYEAAFADEVTRWGVPLLQQGIGTCLPTLLAHGSEQLKREHIPAMLRGDEVWVQLLSEPGAGSDLAGLLTRAETDENGYVLTGVKTWINGAQYADYGMCLARTDASAVKHKGLTMFAVPLRTPGITITPLRKLTGETGFCTVRLDHIHLPPTALVGQPTQGWEVARTGSRRRAVAGAQGRTGVPEEVAARVAARSAGGVDPRDADLLARVFTRSAIERSLIARVRDLIARDALPGAATALIKLVRILRDQGNAADALDAGGLGSLTWTPGSTADAPVHDYLENRSRSVSGGTTEIQLNIVAERVLALPREDRPDLHLPFNQTLTNEGIGRLPSPGAGGKEDHE